MKRIEYCARSERIFRLIIVFFLIVGLTERARTEEPSKRGEIGGKVLDKASRQPIAWVNISAIGTPHGTFSGEDGTFNLPDLPVGTYSVRGPIGSDTNPG